LAPVVAGDEGAFRFADPSALRATLEEAGFRRVEVATVEVEFGPYRDVEAWWATTLDLRGAAVVQLESFPPEVRAQATREIHGAVASHAGAAGIVLRGASQVASGSR
jgi:hypothetical protein